MKLIKMTDFVLSDKIKTQIEMIRYAKFVKQKCNKEMFIGDKALFEGFNILQKEGNEVIYLNEDVWFYKGDLNDYTIESLIRYKLTLTQHAIKQLGL